MLERCQKTKKPYNPSLLQNYNISDKIDCKYKKTTQKLDPPLNELNFRVDF